jgi:helicase
MKRLYSEFEFKILEYLKTKADNGIALRTVMERELRIPKASMTDVLSSLRKNGFVKKLAWTRNRERVEITEAGRIEYDRRVSQRLDFPIPPSVQRYLRSRLPNGKLFPVQQNFADRGLLFSRNNVCVFGYPGSGKTLVAEMVMANDLNDNGKILYVTPYKALDWQKYCDFSHWFGNTTRVVIFDGDNRVSKEELSSAEVIIGTYEAVYGALRNNETWIGNATTIIADEVSLLGEDRGGTVDLLLTELLNRSAKPRIIGLSSLVGNPLEISDWLNAATVIENRPAPGVTLAENIVYQDRQKNIVFLSRNGEIHKEKTDDAPLRYLIKSNLGKNESSLIFVGPRFFTQFIARGLMDLCKEDQTLVQLIDGFLKKERPIDTKLTREVCELVKHGVAFHHAGLQRKVRRFIERLINDGKLKIIVATTTLSHGVDYRIDNVVIDLPSLLEVKRTGLQGYEYINLKGRTGRFDKSKSASVAIMDTARAANKTFKKYFIGSPEPILPETTFDADRLSSIVLLEANAHDISIAGLMRQLGNTLAFKQHLLTRKKLTATLNELTVSGYLLPSGKVFKITDLGKMANEIDLTPSEIKQILELGDDATDSMILHVAVNTGLAKKVRESRRDIPSKSESALKVVNNWLKSMSIDEVRAKSGDYDDQDILDLVKYTAVSLSKMSFVAKQPLKRHVVSLRRRLDRSLARIGFMSTR